MTVDYSPAEAEAALLTVMETALDPIPVFFAWNPAVTEKCAFLGRPLFEGDDVSARVPATITPMVAEVGRPAAGSYTISGTCWSFRPDLTPDGAQTANAEVDAMWMLLQPAFSSLSWVDEITAEYQRRPFEKGWAVIVAFTVQAKSVLS